MRCLNTNDLARDCAGLLIPKLPSCKTNLVHPASCHILVSKFKSTWQNGQRLMEAIFVYLMVAATWITLVILELIHEPSEFAFQAWQGAIRPFRNSNLCCRGSLASPRPREAFQAWQGAIRPVRNSRKDSAVAAWLPQGARKHFKPGRVPSVRFGIAEKIAAAAAWLPQGAGKHFKPGRVPSVRFGEPLNALKSRKPWLE